MLYIDSWLTAYMAVLAAIIGAVGGSFINCLAWRTVRKEKITGGRSHCAICGHVLGVRDLVPVFSWVLLRGRCRYCKEKISPRYLAVELFMACVSMGLLFRFDVSFQYIFYMGFSFLLLAEGLVDLESYEIPDRFQVVSFLWWCLFLPIHSGNMIEYLTDCIAGGFLISVSLLGISLIFDRMMGRESLGGADIKLFFITGLYLGFAVNLLNLIFSCILGLGLAMVLNVSSNRTTRRKLQGVEGSMGLELHELAESGLDEMPEAEPGRIVEPEQIKEPRLANASQDPSKPPDLIPFGPAIGLSTIICILAGKQITEWYMALF